MKTSIKLTIMLIFVILSIQIILSTLFERQIIMISTMLTRSSSTSTATATRLRNTPTTTKSDPKRSEKWEPFNTTNPHPQWCPYARCHNSPICTPCQRRYLFIFATARSASTTLLQVLNDLPNVRLAGENNNTLKKQYKVYNTLVNETKAFRPYQSIPNGPWQHNVIPFGSLGCGIQSLFEIINPPLSFDDHDDSDTIIGFKTVRYHKSTGASLSNLLQFINDVFPCSRIIMNIRSNSTEQTLARTTWFERSSSTEIVKDIIKDENKKLVKMYNMLGQQAQLLDMSSWTVPKEADYQQQQQVYEDLNNVMEWLGYRNCTVTKLYHENNNGYERGNEEDSMVVNRLGKHCHYQGEE